MDRGPSSKAEAGPYGTGPPEGYEEGTMRVVEVCDDCVNKAYDQGVEGYDEQVSTMMSIGAELPDHLCEELELDGEIRCDCGCHGREKQRLRTAKEAHR